MDLMNEHNFGEKEASEESPCVSEDVATFRV